MNFHAMNLSTVMMAENDLMLLMVESVKSKEWPNGLAYVLWEKLIKKFKPSDKVGRQSKQQNCLVWSWRKVKTCLNWSWGLLCLKLCMEFCWKRKLEECLRICLISESESVKSVWCLKSESVCKSLLNLSVWSLKSESKSAKSVKSVCQFLGHPIWEVVTLGVEVETCFVWALKQGGCQKVLKLGVVTHLARVTIGDWSLAIRVSGENWLSNF